jgi:SanA protein
MSKRFWRNIIVLIILLPLAIIAVANYMVSSTTAGQLYSDVNAIPKNKVGLLLGTSKYQDKAKNIINPYYQKRIDAAVELYMAGKIDFIIVSGDNSSAFYNEPVLMRDDLIARGIPENKIYMDYAGFRTLDSILRCRDIFGEDHITIISQRFHNQRALFIANHKHITAVAYNAASGDSFWDEILREKLARVKMLFDLVFNTQAKYYGERVQIK